MPSSAEADTLGAALDGAADTILKRVIAVGSPAATVLLDGRSGAGKSSLADRLVSRWPGADVQLVRLDSVYPGWSGMRAAVETMTEAVLRPRNEGRAGVWPEWDWSAHRVTREHAVAADVPLIVEGCGILTGATKALADVTVWADAPANRRRQRAFERDGDGFEPYWQMWADQEEAHMRRDVPAELADVVLTLP